jgi:hypothetical protein
MSWTEPNGEYVRYEDYARMEEQVKELKSQPDPLTVYLYAAELAKDDMKKLKAENKVLKGQVNYWKIEAECDHGRWLRCLEDLEKLRASSFVTAVPSHQYERVIKAGDNLVFVASEHPVAEPFVKAWFAAKNGWDDAKEGKQP